MLKSIQVAKFRQMIIAGANRLEEHKHSVDELNVFPVPDGDTGTNMSLTMMSAAREVLNAEGADIPGVRRHCRQARCAGREATLALSFPNCFGDFIKVCVMCRRLTRPHCQRHCSLGWRQRTKLS